MMYLYYPNTNIYPTPIGYCFSGWAFFLCLTETFPNFIAWKEAWKNPQSYILNYNGARYYPDDMEMIITCRYSDVERLRSIIGCLRSGIRERIGVSAGPHHLVRRKIGNVFGNYECIGNEDCWDLGIEV